MLVALSPKRVHERSVAQNLHFGRCATLLGSMQHLQLMRNVADSGDARMLRVAHQVDTPVRVNKHHLILVRDEVRQRDEMVASSSAVGGLEPTKVSKRALAWVGVVALLLRERRDALRAGVHLHVRLPSHEHLAGGDRASAMHAHVHGRTLVIELR